MTNLRICMGFEGCHQDYYALAMLARPSSHLLQRVEFMPPHYRAAGGDIVADINVLVPPDMARQWARIGGQTIAPAYMGYLLLYMEIMQACEHDPILDLQEVFN